MGPDECKLAKQRDVAERKYSTVVLVFAFVSGLVCMFGEPTERVIYLVAANTLTASVVAIVVRRLHFSIPFLRRIPAVAFYESRLGAKLCNLFRAPWFVGVVALGWGLIVSAVFVLRVGDDWALLLYPLAMLGSRYLSILMARKGVWPYEQAGD